MIWCDLKRDYAKAVVNSYKSKKENPELVYILSAKRFQSGIQKIKILAAGNKVQKEGIGNYYGIEGTGSEYKRQAAK